MAIAAQKVRRVAVRVASAAAALLAAGATTVVVFAPPAAAASGFTGKLTADCVVHGPNNTYRAVFGYDSTGSGTVRVPAGNDNALTPGHLNGVQTTTFEPGKHRGAFATGRLSHAHKITWKVGSLSATALYTSPTCGPSVSLPADGNGTGPVIALVGSIVVAAGLVALRRRRHRQASA